MTKQETHNGWANFLQFAKEHCSRTAFGNWIAPIRVLEADEHTIALEVPNVFVKEYLLANFKSDLQAFLPVDKEGSPAIRFVIAPQAAKTKEERPPPREARSKNTLQLNDSYRFANFIEGPSNQFVKSAALGVATRPGKSYNPLFIHGGVGLGKTHILHSVGHHILQNHPRLRVQCITTEGFINTLVHSLQTKSIEKLKRFYRNTVDVFLIDDIQFLQGRKNFEEEFCYTFESLIHQDKQIVITCDKPPTELDLSERLTARMEWGLVGHLETPDLETRAAILRHKAELKGLQLSSKIAFYIAEHICQNIRQLEGAVNLLSAHCRLRGVEVTETLVQEALGHLLRKPSNGQISVDAILQSVSSSFRVPVTEITGNSRERGVLIPRQVAMYLARELMQESVSLVASWFGKTHSTVIHACRAVEKRVANDSSLRDQLGRLREQITG